MTTPLGIFSSASDAATGVARLAWFMIILSAVIYAIVIGAMCLGVFRRRARRSDATGVDLSERSIRPILIGGFLLPALVLAAVFVVAESAMGKYLDPRPAVTVHVRAHQWWWELEYEASQNEAGFVTANELHIPVNVPVRLILTSGDVIHSFWVPQLQGKMDVIPGDTNELRLVARRAGTYLGACEEFCGAQHANMAIRVIAEDSASYRAWAADQTAGARPVTNSTLAAGERLVVTGACRTCHTVRGTTANGRDAPDLTHVGSRLTLAAGAAPNSLANIEGWIANPQGIKPGAKMPTLDSLNGVQLRAVAAYLESLK